jgi:hypothetical protein
MFWRWYTLEEMMKIEQFISYLQFCSEILHVEFDASKVHPMELNYHVWHGAIQYRACLMYKRCVWCFMFDTEPFNIELAWCIRDVFGALKLVHTRKTSKKLEHISPWMPQICIGNNPMVLENHIIIMYQLLQYVSVSFVGYVPPHQELLRTHQSTF